MKQTLTEILLEALKRAKEKGELKLETQPAITLETPKDKNHGDLATTLALTLAKAEVKPPRKIAGIMLENIQESSNPYTSPSPPPLQIRMVAHSFSTPTNPRHLHFKRA